MVLSKLGIYPNADPNSMLLGLTGVHRLIVLDVPFEKAMCAMFAYYLIRGDLFVTADFVIPDNKP